MNNNYILRFNELTEFIEFKHRSLRHIYHSVIFAVGCCFRVELYLRRCPSSLRMGGETDSDVLFLIYTSPMAVGVENNSPPEQSVSQRFFGHRRATTRPL